MGAGDEPVAKIEINQSCDRLVMSAMGAVTDTTGICAEPGLALKLTVLHHCLKEQNLPKCSEPQGPFYGVGRVRSLSLVMLEIRHH